MTNDPMLSAEMARQNAQHCIDTGKSYVSVNPEWLIALIDRIEALDKHRVGTSDGPDACGP